jgi:hypothetical protein
MPILLEDEDTIDLCIWFIAPSSSLGRGRGREEGMKDEQTDSEMDRCPNHPYKMRRPWERAAADTQRRIRKAEV